MRDRLRILIVEGDMPLALLMTHLLSSAGCDVQFARTGKKGMELAREHQFDLITMDIELPDVSGFDVCRELKQRHISRRTPVVFISGRPCEENTQLVLEVGAVDYISKPFEVTDFVFRIISQANRKDSPSDFPNQNPHPDAQSLCNTAQGNQ